MKILHVESYAEMSKRAAQLVASQVLLKEDAVLGLATGSTPVGMYTELRAMYDEGHLDFSKVTTFNLDEYVGLEEGHSQSYRHFMNQHFFNLVNVSKEQIFIPSGRESDLAEECISYDKAIADHKGIDMQILGIGRNGHIGFNEPDVKFEATTHVVELDPQTIEDNARFFDSIDEVPKKAISVGIKTIMQARRIILLASGREKAEAIRDMIHGKITPELPASVLQLHPDVTIIVDREAGYYIR